MGNNSVREGIHFW